MTMTPSNRMIALAVAAILSAPAVLAQSAQTTGPASSAQMPGQAQSAPTTAPSPAAPAAAAPMAGKTASASGAAVRVEARIKQLHEQLRITPAQQPQWEQFAQIMRDNAREMDRTVMQRAEQFPTMTALQDMQSYEQIAEAHVQHLQKLIPAFQNLYTALTPEQRNRADEAFRARAESHAQTGNGRNG